MNILISNIQKKIEKKLRELNLKPKISPREFLKIQRKHRYFSPSLSKDGKIVAFYARLHDNLDAKEKFIREINFLKKIKESSLRIKKFVPEILDYGIENDFEWLIREHKIALPLGQSRNLTQEISSEIIKKIVKLILEIAKIPPGNFPGLKKFNCQNYFGNGVYRNLIKKGLIPREISEKLREMVKRSFLLLEKENKYFCHGDMNLGNILSDKKNIWIIDWELIHLNNFAYDIGYLWAHLWEAKRNFRNELMNSYLKELNSQKLLKFKKLLPIVVSYLSLGGIELKKENEKKEIFQKRRSFYLKLLKNCLDFQKLIKI
jgi:hypothetical protein